MNNVNFFRILKKLIIIFILINMAFFTKDIYGTNDVINKQAQMLNIDNFLAESSKTTEEVYGNLDYFDIFNNLITGNTDIKNTFPSIISFFKSESKIIFKSIITIFIVVIINSIFKAVCENLGNESVR